MGRLQGKRCLVTGGSGGIGAVTCELLAREGARVAVHYMGKRDRAEEVAERCRKLGGQAMA
ncbi:MAG: SDR family NAD(P)-dependent oxidoreductase, partial [Halobacteriales archaeon]|nr:SDR family NAD(P)-dependent oxidoreductase [Halobacteriales archaeon]